MDILLVNCFCNITAVKPLAHQLQMLLACGLTEMLRTCTFPCHLYNPCNSLSFLWEFLDRCSNVDRSEHHNWLYCV